MNYQITNSTGDRYLDWKGDCNFRDNPIKEREYQSVDRRIAERRIYSTLAWFYGFNASYDALLSAHAMTMSRKLQELSKEPFLLCKDRESLVDIIWLDHIKREAVIEAIDAETDFSKVALDYYRNGHIKDGWYIKTFDGENWYDTIARDEDELMMLRLSSVEIRIKTSEEVIEELENLFRKMEYSEKTC